MVNDELIFVNWTCSPSPLLLFLHNGQWYGEPCTDGRRGDMHKIVY